MFKNKFISKNHIVRHCSCFLLIITSLLIAQSFSVSAMRGARGNNQQINQEEQNQRQVARHQHNQQRREEGFEHVVDGMAAVGAAHVLQGAAQQNLLHRGLNEGAEFAALIVRAGGVVSMLYGAGQYGFSELDDFVHSGNN